jgi:intermediate cleaving peptidase 55
LIQEYYIEKDNSERGYKQTMFVLPKSPSAELWDGPRTGVESVKELFGADEAFDNTRFLSHLKKVLGSSKHIFMDSPGSMPTLISDESTKKLIESGTLNTFFTPASWDKKRLVISKQGVCGTDNYKKIE